MRLKERLKPLLFPTERVHDERYERLDGFASVRPYLTLFRPLSHVFHTGVLAMVSLWESVSFSRR